MQQPVAKIAHQFFLHGLGQGRRIRNHAAQMRRALLLQQGRLQLHQRMEMGRHAEEPGHGLPFQAPEHQLGIEVIHDFAVPAEEHGREGENHARAMAHRVRWPGSGRPASSSRTSTAMAKSVSTRER